MKSDFHSPASMAETSGWCHASPSTAPLAPRDSSHLYVRGRPAPAAPSSAADRMVWACLLCGLAGPPATVTAASMAAWYPLAPASIAAWWMLGGRGQSGILVCSSVSRWACPWARALKLACVRVHHVAVLFVGWSVYCRWKGAAVNNGMEQQLVDGNSSLDGMDQQSVCNRIKGTAVSHYI